MNSGAGPSAPPVPSSSSPKRHAQSSRPLLQSSAKQQRNIGPAMPPSLPGQREAWMLTPPEAKLRADPLNLKTRRFSRRSGRQQTLSAQAQQVEGSSEQDQSTTITAKAIEEYNREHRAQTLLEMHQKTTHGQKTSSPAERRPFDRERDFKSTTSNASLMAHFGGLSDRFAAGSGRKRFL